MKHLLTLGLVGILTVSGGSGGVDPESSFAKECVALNLDPQTTSSYGLYATKLDLPVNAHPDQIIERKYGFNPSTLPSDELQQRLDQLGFEIVQDLYRHIMY